MKLNLRFIHIRIIILIVLITKNLALANTSTVITRLQLSLTQNWEFTPSNHLDYNLFLLKSNHPDWQPINLPLIQNFTPPNNFAWYRKRFFLDKEFLSAANVKLIQITFTDVRHLARVYLNHQPVGEHFGGYHPFSFRINRMLKPGENELIVGVQDWSAATALPAEAGAMEDEIPVSDQGQGQSQGQNQGQGQSQGQNQSQGQSQEQEEGIPAGDYAVPEYQGFPIPGTIIAPIGYHERAGICGSVYLEAVPYLHIDNLVVTPNLPQKKLKIAVEITAEQEKDIDIDKLNLQLIFWVRELGVVKELKLKELKELKEEKNREKEVNWKIETELDFDQAKLWNIDHPYLYQLKAGLKNLGLQDPNLTVDGEIIDEVEVTFGYREFSLKGPHFFLNGERINLREAVLQYYNGQTPDILKEQIQKLKQAHFNLVRFHTEPVPSWMLDICDQEGILVSYESALYGSYLDRYDTSFNSQLWPMAKDHWLEAVRQGINHPSVVIWSIENENLEYNAGHDGEVRFMELGLQVKRADHSRPIMYEGGLDAFGASDVINLHYPHEFPFWNCLPNDAWWLEAATFGYRHKAATSKMPALPVAQASRLCGSTKAFLDKYTYNDQQTRHDQQTKWPVRDWGSQGLYLDSLWRWQPDYRFVWNQEKPLFIGEELFMPSPVPDPYTILIGDNAYLEWKTSPKKVKAAAWQDYIEAYRYAEVAGICPWVIEGKEEKDSPLYLACQESFKPVTIFVRERQTRFWEGEKVQRTISVYNDEPGKKSSQGDNFIVEWQVSGYPDIITQPPSPQPVPPGAGIGSDSILCQGKERFSLQAGYKRDVTINFVLPQTAIHDLETQNMAVQKNLGRLEAGPTDVKKYYLIRVKVTKNGQLRDEKLWTIWGFKPDHGKVAGFSRSGQAYLYDPEGSTTRILDQEGIVYKRISDHHELKGSPKALGSILIFGQNAFSYLEDKKISVGDLSLWAGQIYDFVNHGGILIAFEQEFYPPWLPSQITLNYLHHSTITFPGQTDHPILNGISKDDLQFWAADNLVSSYSLNLPLVGNYYSLIDSGGTGGLVYSPLMEIIQGKGRMILCQMLVTQKWDHEPIARLLFRNILKYAIARQFQGQELKSQELKGQELKSQSEDQHLPDEDKQTEIKIGSIRAYGKNIMVFEGDKEKDWEIFAQNKKAWPDLLDFVKQGGKVLIRGINEKNIKWINKILPVKIRKITKEDLPVKVIDIIDIAVQKSFGRLEAGPTVEAVSSRRGKIFPDSYSSGILPESKPRLYNRDLYWVEEHSEFSYNWAGFDEKIADYVVIIDSETEIPPDFKVRSYTNPSVLVEFGFGKGFFLIDQVKWENQGVNKDKAQRYASSLGQYLGVYIQENELGNNEPGSQILLQAENMSCRTPGQPLIRCRSHDYWGIYSSNSISESVEFLSKDEYTITVRAKARRPSSPPVMALFIDDALVEYQIVPSLSWDEYLFSANIEKGEHEITISLINAEDPYQEKYLYVDWIRIKKN